MEIQNEVYYTLSNHDLVPPTSVIGHCVISSQHEDAINALFEDDDYDEDKFVCFYAANTARGLYYDFNWSEFHRQALSSEGTTGDSWTLEPAEMAHSDRKQGKDKKGKRRRKFIKTRKDGDVPRTPRRRKVTTDGDVDMEVDESSDDVPDEETYNPESDTGSSADEPMEASEEEDTIRSDGEDVMEEPKTPSKRRKQGAPRTPRRREVPTTPSRRGRRLAAPTPHSKAALRARKRSIAVRPPPQLSQEHYKALTM
jgi:origin recognition complex subunit 1